MLMTNRTDFPLSVQRQEAIMNADYVVAVERREGATGFIAISISDSVRHGGFSNTTVGLFGDEDAHDILNTLQLIGSQVGEGDFDAPPVFRYIGRQCCPIEWQSEYENNDPEIRRRFRLFSLVINDRPAASRCDECYQMTRPGFNTLHGFGCSLAKANEVVSK